MVQKAIRKAIHASWNCYVSTLTCHVPSKVIIDWLHLINGAHMPVCVSGLPVHERQVIAMWNVWGSFCGICKYLWLLALNSRDCTRISADEWSPFDFSWGATEGFNQLFTTWHHGIVKTLHGWGLRCRHSLFLWSFLPHQTFSEGGQLPLPCHSPVEWKPTVFLVFCSLLWQ